MTKKQQISKQIQIKKLQKYKHLNLKWLKMTQIKHKSQNSFKQIYNNKKNIQNNKTKYSNKKKNNLLINMIVYMNKLKNLYNNMNNLMQKIKYKQYKVNQKKK